MNSMFCLEPCTHSISFTWRERDFFEENPLETEIISCSFQPNRCGTIVLTHFPLAIGSHGAGIYVFVVLVTKRKPHEVTRTVHLVAHHKNVLAKRREKSSESWSLWKSKLICYWSNLMANLEMVVEMLSQLWRFSTGDRELTVQL
ncbi:hypothetical protein TanjilG_12216 [Lupinus angustifolius]|uniref:Uncharacterized protein n=1 Tax=Lupinus angustifolius TaxID=3871 RepID=A0A1J7IA37_LUPAN|nr:hypothetical protein TanjilG_12216 [Lupinus angustifolius]